MILPRPEDAKHKYQLYRLLTAILENNHLANTLYFKGGTYAAMRGVLNRFSVDLDFDLVDKTQKAKVRTELAKIFGQLKLKIKDQSREHLQFYLEYSAPQGERNTLKLEITDLVSPENEYEVVTLHELNLICRGQTIPTMFANKLYAASARLAKTGHLAGRDFYDIHQFFLQGLTVNKEVVVERSGKPYTTYLQKLRKLIEDKLSDEYLYQDLNPLLPGKDLKGVAKTLKRELLVFLGDEIKRAEVLSHA
jgi:predicted nucleotidyltransferase component of viral defense system